MSLWKVTLPAPNAWAEPKSARVESANAPVNIERDFWTILFVLFIAFSIAFSVLLL
jgi:hypothetical protein